MASPCEFTGLPKGVVGRLGRDTTDRPAKLRLKAPRPSAAESTLKRSK